MHSALCRHALYASFMSATISRCRIPCTHGTHRTHQPSGEEDISAGKALIQCRYVLRLHLSVAQPEHCSLSHAIRPVSPASLYPLRSHLPCPPKWVIISTHPSGRSVELRMNSGPILSIYLEMATEDDKKMVEGWKADADGILIFVRLSSSPSSTHWSKPGLFSPRRGIDDLSVHSGPSTKPTEHPQFLLAQYSSGYNGSIWVNRSLRLTQMDPTT
jgi:hypothetical protein